MNLKLRMWIFPMLAWVIFAVSCSTDAQNNSDFTTKDYFSVNAFLDSQIVILKDNQLLKITDDDSLLIEKPSWKDELKVFRSFDINKSVWKGEFRLQNIGQTTIYSTENENIKVKSLKIIQHEGKIISFTGVLIDENILYRIEKTISFKLDGGKIVHYRLNSKQKILFQDEFLFKIDAFVK